LLASRQLTLLAAVSLALGCTLEDHPSLGRYAKPAAPGPEVPEMRDTRGSGAEAAAGTGSVSTSAGSGGARAPSAPPAASDSGARTAPAASSDAAGLAVDAPLAADAGGRDSGANLAPTCAGLYRGSFTCVTTPAVVDPPTATSPIQLYVQQPQVATTANVSSSMAFSYAGFDFAANLYGQLDCTTNVFHADIVNGLFAAQLAPIPIPFSGTVDGTRDEKMGNLSGSWSFSGPAGGSCDGTWSARLQP
jgi:hypothetical protein